MLMGLSVSRKKRNNVRKIGDITSNKQSFLPIRFNAFRFSFPPSLLLSSLIEWLSTLLSIDFISSDASILIFLLSYILHGKIV